MTVPSNSRIQMCRECFAEELFEEYGFIAYAKSVNFWAPNFRVLTPKDENITGKNIKDFATRLNNLSQTFPSALKGREARQEIHVFVTAKSMVTLNWQFHQLDCTPSHPMSTRLILPPNEFKNYSISRFVEKIASELLRAFQFKAEANSITFYTPKKLVPKGEFIDEKDIVKVSSSHTFDDEVCDPDLNNDSVHFVVTAKGRQIEDEEHDVLCELSESKRFEKTLNAMGKSPSKGFKSIEYRTAQGTVDQAIFDGHYAPGKDSTCAPPIYIYHPIFNDFRYYLQHPPQPTKRDIANTLELMNYLCKLTEESESTRNERVCNLLEKILNVRILPAQHSDETEPDGMTQVEVGDEKIAILVAEFNKILGEGDGDPCIQAGISYKRGCQSTEAIKRSCSPAFLIHGEGAWLGISGAVFTDKVIVQRLTDARWFGLSSTEEDIRLWENACTLLALRVCLEKLKDYYQNNIANIMPWVPHGAHPRLYPYPTSYTHDGQEIKFEYVMALEDYAKCVTFLARTLGDGSRDIVVKYVTSYGECAHRFLASQDHAPKLLYYGPLPGAPLLSPSPAAKKAIPGLCLDPAIYMVVMEYIDAESLYKLPRKYRAQVDEILAKLHGAGYVFGDLRNQNVLIDPDSDRVKLIDFDWSGAYDQKLEDTIETKKYAYYPSLLSQNITWPNGAGRLEPILPEHDLAMARRLF